MTALSSLWHTMKSQFPGIKQNLWVEKNTLKQSTELNTTSDRKFPKERNEHAFAPFVRILGKGKKGSRSLSREEARTAMGMILDGQVLDLQLGAFLMLLRVKEESPEELAGFVEAAQARFQTPNVEFDIDWSSYAGKKRHPPWFLLSAVLLAQNGIRIFMHGAEGHTQGRLYTREVAQAFQLPIAQTWEDVTPDKRFIYMPLDVFSARLHEIIQMRSILGLRSPVHSMARLLNPLNAPLVVQGIFHPPYSPIHQQSAALLKYPQALVIKGEGGEFERNPDIDCQVRYVKNGEIKEEVWPKLFARRHVKPEQLSIDHMRAVWEGHAEDEYAEAAIISTTAVVLSHHRDALQTDEASALAKSWWQKRDREIALSSI